MSNAEQFASAAIGATIGFFVGGGPAGAVYGFQYGLLAGSVLFPTELPGIEGPRLQDFERIDAEPGAPVPIVFGTGPVAGHRMYLGPVTEIEDTEEVGGKGPPGQDVTTFHYLQTLALGLCEGEIKGVRRIWENGKLVYDARPASEVDTVETAGTPFAKDDYDILVSVWGQINSAAQFDDINWSSIGYEDGNPLSPDATQIVSGNWSTIHVAANFTDIDWFEAIGFMSAEERAAASAAYADTFNLYLGTEDQEPDPQLEIELGEGNVPAFRGLAYIVFPKRELRPDQGTRHPVFKIEVAGLRVAESSDPTYTIVAFTDPAANGTSANDFNVPAGVHTLDAVAVVGGGGAGGTSGGSGGGGGGQVVLQRNVVVTPQATLPAVVGAGGVHPTTNPDDPSDGNGMPSSFLGFTALGGGGGAQPHNFFSGATGASGGGGGSSFTNGNGQGGDGLVGGDGGDGLSAGANSGGGGGGGADALFGNGQDASREGDERRGGNGGQGVDLSMLFPGYGDDGWFGGGGGGGGGAALNGTPAVAGEGGKGGGGRGFNGTTSDGTAKIPVYNSGGGAGGNHQGDTGSLDGGPVRNIGTGGDGIVLIRYESAPGDKPPVPGGVTLADIVDDICGRVSLSSVDSTDLENDMIHGYVISRPSTAQSALEPLRQVGTFDYAESDGDLKCTKRGKAAVTTLTVDDLGPVEEGSEIGPIVTTRKVQDFELPRQIRLQYLSFERDYELSEQLSPVRIETDSVNDVSVEVPVVLSDDEAVKLAEVLFRESWASRYSHSFSVDLGWHSLEPGDALLLPVDGRLQRVRIGAITDVGLMVRRIDAVRDDDGSYTSIRVGHRDARGPTVIEILGGTQAEYLDLPALREEDDNAGFYVAGWKSGGNAWAGAAIHRSLDEGATYQSILSIAAQAVAGTIVSAPSRGDGYTWDVSGEIVVDLVNGALESRLDSAVLAGANAAAIGGPGRWQIVQFANAELIGLKRYRLSRLLLGRRGTEHLIGTTEVGDRFVLLSGPGIVRAPLQTSQIGAEVIYRAVTAGLGFSSAEDETFTGEGAALETFAPVHVTGVRNEGGDLTISWFRRDRLAQELRDGVELVNSEQRIEFEVDILADDSGQTVLRTIEVEDDTEAVYTAAQQTTDFGAVPDLVTVRIYQISATVGRGVPAEATV